MNYYEHHLGDYLRDTAHLSMLEDGAYRRLIDAYYIRETPLPLELRDVYRLVRAQSKQDREAVDTVLREFFVQTPEGWKHNRCDREIGRFQDKQRKARASAEARWSQRQSHSEGNANAYANASPDAMRTHMRTHSEGNAPRARPQTPDTRHQSSEAELPTVNGAGAPDAKPMTVDDLVAEGVPKQVASDWLKVRRAKKAPLTRTAWDAVKREAGQAGLTPAKAVQHAAEAGWQGFKAAWLERGGGTKPPGPDLMDGVH